MNANLVANVTLVGLAITCFTTGIQIIESGDYVKGGILFLAGIILFGLYELFPNSTPPSN